MVGRTNLKLEKDDNVDRNSLCIVNIMVWRIRNDVSSMFVWVRHGPRDVINRSALQSQNFSG